jgi:hypothetical protein
MMRADKPARAPMPSSLPAQEWQEPTVEGGRRQAGRLEIYMLLHGEHLTQFAPGSPFGMLSVGEPARSPQNGQGGRGGQPSHPGNGSERDGGIIPRTPYVFTRPDISS